MRPASHALIILLLLGFAGMTGCSREEVGKTPAADTAAPSLSGGTPIELSYVPTGFPLGLSVGQGFGLHLFETPGADQKFREMPPDSPSRRYYDELTLAGKPHLVITEESKPPRFWFDENRNGNLTDDRGPFTAEKEGFLPNNLTIQVRYDAEKVVAPYRMWLFSSNMGGVRFYPLCHWAGALDLEGESYPLVAFDGNADGDYSNDPLVVDLNRNGTADEGEKLLPGNPVQIGGKNVTLVGVSPSGLTARFKW